MHEGHPWSGSGALALDLRQEQHQRRRARATLDAPHLVRPVREAQSRKSLPSSRNVSSSTSTRWIAANSSTSSSDIRRTRAGSSIAPVESRARHRTFPELHDEELVAEHVTGRLVPERLRRAHRCGSEDSKQVVLLSQVIWFEQAGRARAPPKHDLPFVATAVVPAEREQDCLGRVTGRDVLEVVDGHRRHTEFRGEPLRELGLLAASSMPAASPASPTSDHAR